MDNRLLSGKFQCGGGQNPFDESGEMMSGVQENGESQPDQPEHQLRHADGAKTVLWWSRGGRNYSRDRIVRDAFRSLGWRIKDFSPIVSGTADVEARFRRIAVPDLLWVPCFRQRDAAAAQRWASRAGVPLVLDPLISAWDKQVSERKKFPETSARAQRLLTWESSLFRNSDAVVADTECHAEFFARAHCVDQTKLSVIPVSAEESLFAVQPAVAVTKPIRVLFYGSFIGLQGPQFIAQAARHVPEMQWTFIGSGPLLDDCQNIAGRCDNVEFIPRVPYEELARHIGQADILMGVFGESAKAARVIPNKVYQSLACGRPVVTRSSDAYPGAVRLRSSVDSGLTWASGGSSSDIVSAVRQLAKSSDELVRQGNSARATYERFFSNQAVCDSLRSALAKVGVLTDQKSPQAA